MLPDRHRLHTRGQFTAVMRGGRRCGRTDFMVHVLVPPAGPDLDTAVGAVPGPRFGLIVSKAVGNAVVRHRVSRRLRHVAAGYTGRLPESASIVLRAFPSAADAGSHRLDRQLAGALRKLGLLDATGSPAAPSPAPPP